MNFLLLIKKNISKSSVPRKRGSSTKRVFFGKLASLWLFSHVRHGVGGGGAVANPFGGCPVQ
jgi:hypothetical protein